MDLYFIFQKNRMLGFRWIVGLLFPLSILDFARNIECLFDHFTSWFNMFQSVRDQQVHCDHINIFMLFLISVDYPSFTRFHKKRLISWFWIMLILPGLSTTSPRDLQSPTSLSSLWSSAPLWSPSSSDELRRSFQHLGSSQIVWLSPNDVLRRYSKQVTNKYGLV